MQAHTNTIQIATTLQAAVDFLREPANLPRWAVGFAKSARQQDGQWLVATGSGEVAVRIEVEPALGVVVFSIFGLRRLLGGYRVCLGSGIRTLSWMSRG